jgi:DNA-binding CsgD family transcriptional regulator/tetratricopeptide (TPR) repeat protein
VAGHRATESANVAHPRRRDAYLRRWWDHVHVVVDLLDRQVELDALGAAVDRAAAGHGSTVLVTGEAGIGKTSLVRAFLAGAATGVRVLAGGCEDLFTPRPLGPLLDAARATTGPLSEALRAPVDQGWLFAAAAEELAEPPSPTVLVIEDAHWADGATLDVLRYLASRIYALPAVLVITFRDDALGIDHPLRTVLGGLTSANTERLRLASLSASSVGRLAEATDVDADELFRLTGGNPFFVSEVLAFPEETVAPTIVDAVLARVAALDEPAQAALGRVAVVPSGVELDLLRRLFDDLGPIGQAERAGVLEVRGSIVGFRHELARRAVVQSLPAIQRLQLNTEVLDVLLCTDADPFRILHHAVEAADDGAVVTHGLIAAGSASRMGAHRQAAACYEQVLSRGELLDPAHRARVGEAYAWALSNSNQLDPAAGAASLAVDGWEQVGDDAHLVRALVTLSRQQWLTERTAASLSSAERALAISEHDPETEQRAWAQLNLGGLMILLDREEEGLPHLHAALDLADRLRLPNIAALCHDYRGSARLQLGDRVGEVELLESVELARTTGNQEYVLRAYYNLVEGLWRLGDLKQASTYLDATEDYVRDRDFPVYTYMCKARRLRLLGMSGQWDDAAAGLAELMDGRGDPGMIGRETLPFLARIRVRQGHPDAPGLLEQAREHVRRAELLEWSVPVGLACIEDAWLTDSPKTAAPFPETLVERTDRPGMLVQRGELMRYLRRLGLPATDFPGCPDTYAAGLSGDWQAAAQLWEEAGDPYERALELAESGETAPTLEAIGILDALGAVPAGDLARRRLRALGVTRVPSRPLPSTRDNPAGLTDRQVEILRLVGSGMSNAEIATRLFVSVRTVDHHVSAILQKLGTPTRREASALIGSLGLND